jgi:hypothetical protein
MKVKGKENPYLLAMKRAVILSLCALMGEVFSVPAGRELSLLI